MESTMTRRRTTARRLSLEVGFEPRRDGEEVLADAYERPLPPMARPLSATPSVNEEAHNAARSCWLPGCWAGGSCDQSGDECTEQGFAAAACVVHDLEEAEIERQLVLRDTAVRPQPGAQQRPEAFERVDVHLAEPVAVLVACIL